jgi:hypothetical protein
MFSNIVWARRIDADDFAAKRYEIEIALNISLFFHGCLELPRARGLAALSA